MSIKLIAFDLDGTTLVEHKHLPAENREALTEAGKKGIIIVPATGRILDFLPDEIRDIPYVKYAITANGGGVYDIRTKELLHSACISPEKSQKVQKIIDEYGLFTEYYIKGIPYSLNCDITEVKKSLPTSKHHFLSKPYHTVDSFYSLTNKGYEPEKINLPFLPIEIRAEVRNRISEIPGLSITSSIPDNLEINDISSTKGQGLKALCGILGISRSECMAIGDNGNDVDMLKFAEVSVAMGNASEEAFKAAKYRTASCEDLGLSKAVRQYALNS